MFYLYFKIYIYKENIVYNFKLIQTKLKKIYMYKRNKRKKKYIYYYIYIYIYYSFNSLCDYSSECMN